MKNSNDTIGNRTRDLLACSRVQSLFNVRDILTEIMVINTNYGDQHKSW